jgi:membrane protein implicated in regulation of membrane protease activity
MTTPNDLRWKFRVIEIPEPARSGMAYKWVFIGIGISVGCGWANLLIMLLGRHRANLIAFATVSLIVAWQAIYMAREGKRLKRELEAVRAMMNQKVGPELTDEENGNGSHCEETR